jgi:uncharacterized protein YkwD
MRNLVRVIVVAAGVAALSPSAAAAQSSCPTGSDLASARPAVLCFVNAERRAHGLPPLREHGLLRRAAHRFATRMVNQNFFAHDRASVIRRVRRTGYLRHYPRWWVGENLGWGHGTESSPQAIVKAWMASPPHRRNILSPRFRRIGIGIAPGAPVTGTSGITYVTDFGMRRR